MTTRAQRFETGTAQARKNLARLEKLDVRIGLVRLIGTIVLLAVMVPLFGTASHLQRFAMVTLFAGLLLLTAFFHRKLQKKRDFWKGISTSLRLSDARARRDFTEILPSVAPWHATIASQVPTGHLYAIDLDIAALVFPFLDTCATRAGAERLFSDLLEAGTQPLAPDFLKRRRVRVNALAQMPQILRRLEALRLNEQYLAAYLQQTEQEKREEQENSNNNEGKQKNNRSRWYLLAFPLLMILSWFVLIAPAWIEVAFKGSWDQLTTALMLYIAIPILGLGICEPLIAEARSLDRRIKPLLGILRVSHELKKSAAFSGLGFLRDDALKQAERLELFLDLFSLRGNPIFWVALHALLPFDALVFVLLFFRLGHFRSQVSHWLNDLTEFDVTCALARMLMEDKTLRLPTDDQAASSQKQLTMRQIGHPLLPAARRICNDFELTQERSLVVLTGSNMSGKSTFLRTIGLNFVLHSIGAPTCGQLQFTHPVRILCAIRVDDSITEGLSYFYAEVRRLKALFDQLEQARAEGRQTLVLIDEIFRGTNNRERYAGSWHILKALSQQGCFALVSTHDLALTEIEKQDQRLCNMHFREEVHSDRLSFDYLLKTGPCPTTNALTIMRNEGLPIPAEALTTT